jgi:hypothetical protein
MAGNALSEHKEQVCIVQSRTAYRDWWPGGGNPGDRPDRLGVVCDGRYGFDLDAVGGLMNAKPGDEIELSVKPTEPREFVAKTLEWCRCGDALVIDLGRLTIRRRRDGDIQSSVIGFGIATADIEQHAYVLCNPSNGHVHPVDVSNNTT